MPRPRSQFWRWMRLAALAANLIVGCDRPASPGLPPIGPVFPVHHTAAAWSTNNEIAYRNNGITNVAPDGSYETDPSKAGVWVLALGADSTNLVIPRGFAPDWSPAGDSLVCAAEGVFIAARTGSGVRRISNEGSTPVWSPSGDRIALEISHDIWIMDRDGAHAQEIGTHGVGGSFRPAWIPGRDRLVHVRYVSNVQNLFSMAADGTNVTQITSNTLYKLRPRVSPDGQHIAVSLYGSGEQAQVWVMGIDGTAATRITTSGGIDPAWSPSGGQIVYTKYDAYVDSAANGVLWIVDMNTRQETQITFR